jgi:CHASE2 domain-containing sensor protein
VTGAAPSRGFAAWLMRHLPRTIAVHSERVIINGAVALIGLAVLVGNHDGALNRLWPFPLYEWAVTMLVGGVAVLIGMFRDKRSIERLGLILVAVGSLFYAGLLLYAFGSSAIFTAIIFVAIAAAKTIRLVVGSAIRSNNIQLGEQMKETPPPPPGALR